MTQSKIDFILVMIKINYELEQRHDFIIIIVGAYCIKN